jgi:hypothetical protein
MIIKVNGQEETNLGEKLTYFYHSVANLHITTTGIRAMFETVANEKLQASAISDTQAAAISRVIGHSRSTAQSSYISNDCYFSVVNTQSAESALGIRNEDTESLIEQTHKDSAVSSIIQPISYSAKPFGIRHPHFDSNANRIPFSLEEKAKLIEIVEAEKVGTRIPDNIASICLRKIKTTDDLIPIFHVRHILSTGRLRSALKNLGYVQ